MSTPTNASEILKGAFIGGLINAVINGAINWFSVKNESSIQLTDNLISSEKHTVFAGAVPLAVSLAFILTCIAYFTTKINPKPPFFPSFFFMAIRNAIFAFGLVVAIATLVQRYGGTMYVGPMGSVLITALIAGVVSGIVNYLTVKEMVKA